MNKDFCIFLIVILLSFVSSNFQDELKTVEALAGHIAELPCNVTAEKEDDKLDILLWFRNGSTTSLHSSDLRSNSVNGSTRSNGRYRLVSLEGDGMDHRLQIASLRPSDQGVYYCVAQFASSPTQRIYTQLDIIEPVQRLWVIHENGSRVATAAAETNTSQDIGPYFVEDTVHLFCVSFGGQPQPSVSWWSDDQVLKSSLTPLSQLRVRSDLSYGPLTKEDHGTVLTCYATNHDIAPPLSIDITIDMYLPPELIKVHSGAKGGAVSAGESLPLQCRVLGARPLPPVSWLIGDQLLTDVKQNVTMEASQRLIVSEIMLIVLKEHDESMIRCCVPANTRQGDVKCSDGLPLTVTYAPILTINAKDQQNETLPVIKGSNTTLNCSYEANPSVYKLIWYHQDDIVQINNSDISIEPILELNDVKESDAGEYVCAAFNDVGYNYSEPINVDVIYPADCEDKSIAEFGLAENESINLTCVLRSNPKPRLYRWVVVDEAVNETTLRLDQPHRTHDTDEPTLLYQRPNDTAFSTIFCWGENDVDAKDLPNTPCVFLVTDETVPRPPTDCVATKNDKKEITVSCQAGHNGGLPQKFTFTVKSDADEIITSIISIEPKFIIQEPDKDNYKIIIYAHNAKGDSKTVEIAEENVTDESKPVAMNTVTNITTLSLSLCGGVLVVALAACGLVLCAHERAARVDLPLTAADPPLCAYTDDTNCETFDSDGSECNVRRTESFRRAVSKYPSQSYDVRRTSSFHSAKYETGDDSVGKYDTLRHGTGCRMHSLQNISRKRDMDVLCDHLVTHLPPEPTYNVHRPMNTFYTMPRKIRHKPPKEISDETSEITQTSDGFSLPPPPDEFTSYRAGMRIRDIPRMQPYTAVIRNTAKEPKHYGNVMSSMNTVGVPAVNAGQGRIYTYPDDEGHQTNTNPFEDSP